MANDYYSWTVPMPEADVPAELAPDGVSLPGAVSDAMGQPDAVCTKSRNNWLHFMLDKMFESHGNPALAFLVKDPESLPDLDPALFQPVSRDSRFHWSEIWVITQLPLAEVAQAIDGIDAWLDAMAKHPEQFAYMLSDDCDHAALAQSIHDAVDLREAGSFHEDGDFAGYMFCFLKSLRAVLRDALSRDMAIVHVRYVYVFREMAAT